VPGRMIVDIAYGAGPFEDVTARLERGGRLWVGGLMGSSRTLLTAVLRKRFPHTWVVVAPNTFRTTSPRTSGRAR